MGLSTLPHPATRLIALPAARGPVSQAVIDTLRRPPGSAPAMADVPPDGDVLVSEDLQLALYLCYELHYTGIRDVDPAWEWDPGLLRVRAALERPFEARLRALAGDHATIDEDAEVGTILQRIVAADDGPSLSRYIEARATMAELHEFFIHRSAYQLKEADPHAWAIPRLSGRAKAALVEIQSDEYGGGDPERVHATLFAKSMEAAGLDASYGAYLERLPAITLATVNVMSMCGLHRRLRGAIVGHLAVFEMTSSLPNRRYGNAVRRLGLGPGALDFFDEHVEADAVHENIAAWDMANRLSLDEPGLRDDILFGARGLLAVEEAWSRHLLDAWAAGRSSLRECG